MAPQEALSVAEQTLELLHSAAPMLALLGTGCLLFFTLCRSGTAHFMRERIWRLLGGSEEIDNTFLAERWREIKDLESLRYKTGIRFANLDDAMQMFKWADELGVSADDLMKSAKYYNPSDRSFANPKQKSKALLGMFLVFGLLLAWMLFGFLALTDYALLKVKQTSTRIWTDGETVMPLNRLQWSMTLDDCAKEITFLPDAHDRKVVCELFKPETKEYLQQAVTSQKTVAVIFEVLFGVLFGLVMHWQNKVALAQQIYSKSQAQKAATPPLSAA
ncbi:DUF6216 family protein [Atopomonas hussainii]|uniref:DUF6216 family protein n=1 Tax=Atopomonas hussainii TaxID=1429083 RepID=UPI0009002E3A|nr:DUF6216 family protein [Atopomonas hussainii]